MISCLFQWHLSKVNRTELTEIEIWLGSSACECQILLFLHYYNCLKENVKEKDTFTLKITPTDSNTIPELRIKNSVFV